MSKWPKIDFIILYYKVLPREKGKYIARYNTWKTLENSPSHVNRRSELNCAFLNVLAPKIISNY